jgi:hypothetical protein
MTIRLLINENFVTGLNERRDAKPMGLKILFCLENRFYEENPLEFKT